MFSLDLQLLADLENNKMFSDDLECQKLLMEAMKYHLLPERRPMFQSPRTKPRKSTVGALYAVGGMDATKGAPFVAIIQPPVFTPLKRFIVASVSAGSTTIEKYDLRTNTWVQVGIMNGRRLQFGVAVIDNKLYVVGGRDGLKTSNMVECYNPLNNVWSTMPPMSTHRHGLGECLEAILPPTTPPVKGLDTPPHSVFSFIFATFCYGGKTAN